MNEEEFLLKFSDDDSFDYYDFYEDATSLDHDITVESTQ